MRYKKLTRQYSFGRNISEILDENIRCSACRQNRNTRHECDCGCGCDTNCTPTGLAIASVPNQTWHEIYETEKGFNIGTIFAELNMPFGCAGRGM